MSIYLFPGLHVLCDRKHAISVISISVFFFGTFTFEEWSALKCVAIHCRGLARNWEGWG